jgi:hypothetical protein
MRTAVHFLKELRRPEFVPSLIVEERINAGWDHGHDVGFEPVLKASDIPNIELVKFLIGQEHTIYCAELQRRAEKLRANFGLSHADFFLRNWRDIPRSFEVLCLALPGTTMYKPGHIAQMGYMKFYKEQGWTVGFKGFDSLVDDNYFRLLRLP